MTPAIAARAWVNSGTQQKNRHNSPMTKAELDNVAEQLRAAIRADGRDMKAIATAADVPYTSLYRFMEKGASLRLETAAALARALGLKALKV